MFDCARTREVLGRKIVSSNFQKFTRLESLAFLPSVMTAKTPRPILQRLNAEAAKVLRESDVQAKIRALDGEAESMILDRFDEFVHKERAANAQIVKGHTLSTAIADPETAGSGLDRTMAGIPLFETEVRRLRLAGRFFLVWFTFYLGQEAVSAGDAERASVKSRERQRSRVAAFAMLRAGSLAQLD
jgi:hypothetical protein